MKQYRLNLSQEKTLWAVALIQFGPEGLQQVVREIWYEVGASASSCRNSGYQFVGPGGAEYPANSPD